MKILITAGPTRELLDPVRFLSNFSSGEMGYALAREAKKSGHRVTLISGPVSLPPPSGIRLISIESALELRRACLREFPRHDTLIMSAAVCDFTPLKKESQKILRSGVLHLSLKKTPDIVAEIAQKKKSKVVIGFCLETSDWIRKAKQKLLRKKLDGIVANYCNERYRPFGNQKVHVALIDKSGVSQEFRDQGKQQLARRIIVWMEGLATL